MAVIGLDGVGLPLVQDLTARGVMPRLGALLPAGTAAPMRSSIPTISSVSWTGFMTGQNPGKHGIYGFTDVKPGTLTTFFPNFGNVKSETLWDVAGRAGKRAIVLNVPNTYPARALNGLLVSGFVAVNLERAVYPAELLLVGDAIRPLILKRSSADVIRDAGVKLGMRTLREDGWHKVRTGVTTVGEVVRVTQEEV